MEFVYNEKTKVFGIKLEGKEIGKFKDTLKSNGFRYFKTVWTRLGFTDMARFQNYVSALLNGGNPNAKGIKPLKSAEKEQKHSLYKASSMKRKEWVMNANLNKFEYVKSKWSETIAMVVEHVCEEDKTLKFWKLTDEEIDLLALKHINEIEKINEERGM